MPTASSAFIARIPPVAPGTPVSADFKAAILKSPEGWFLGRTREGLESYTPYVTSGTSGWVLGIAMPASVIEAGAWRALWVTSAGVLAALCVALWLAWLFARRIADPIAALAQVGWQNRRAIPHVDRIDEIARLRDVLDDTSRAARERQEQLEREQRALQEQSELLQQRTDEAEALMQVMPIAVLKTEDPECRRITGNPAAYRFFNLATGANLSKSAPPDEFPSNHRIFREGREVPPDELPMQYAIANECEVSGQELEFRFAEETKFGYLHVSPLFDAHGTARGAICAILDITESKEADRRKDEFLATLAHELRNPLAPIVNALQIMDVAKHDPAVTAKARQVLERQVRQMQRLIDDLMDVSRISRGKIVLRREKVELRWVVDHAVDASRPALDALGHHLQVILPPVPLWLDCDATRLAQLLTNLLGNACKFTPRGGNIRLEAGRQGAELIISVDR